MRGPPLGFDAIPYEPLKVFFEEILAAPGTAHLLVGLYDKSLPLSVVALVRHLEEPNSLADAPRLWLIRSTRL